MIAKYNDPIFTVILNTKDKIMSQNAIVISKLVRTSLLSLAALYTSSALSFNMSYVEVNSNALSNVGCYIRSDNQQPFFDAVSIFAGNINGSDPNAPQLFFNPNVEAVLQSSQVKNLQAQGIKVLMTLLDNHENAGWSCMTDSTAIQQFANDVVTMVNTYQFDGVDIDDEYAACQTNDYSLIRIAQAIKANPAFKGKLLTKALYEDSAYFKASYQGHRLADYLDYGWEMSYSDDQFADRLAVYLQNGMTPSRVMLGAWTAVTYPTPYQIAQYNTQNSLAGTMVYDITSTSQDYLTQIFQGQLGSNVNVTVTPGCLQ